MLKKKKIVGPQQFLTSIHLRAYPISTPADWIVPFNDNTIKIVQFQDISEGPCVQQC